MPDIKRKILLVAYGGGHVAMLVPVWEKLTADGHDVIFLALTTAQKYLSERSIPYIGFCDLPDSKDHDVQVLGQRLVGELSDGKVSYDESVAYMGLSYRDLVIQHGQNEAEKLYNAYGRQVFLPVNTLKKAIQMIAPDVVVATNSPRAERAAIMAANACGIPAVCVVDLYPCKELEWLAEPRFAKKICVLNNSVRDILLKNGRCIEDVVVTGNPAFDKHYAFNDNQNIAKIKSDIFDEKIVVGFASNSIPAIVNGISTEAEQELPQLVFNRMQKLCSERNYALALRQHPSEAEWHEIGNAVNCKSMPLDLYLASLDMLITFPSTIALEAQIYGTRTGVINFSCLSQTSPYLFTGDFEVIQQIEDIDSITIFSRIKNTELGDRHVSSATQLIGDVILNAVT